MDSLRVSSYLDEFGKALFKVPSEILSFWLFLDSIDLFYILSEILSKGDILSMDPLDLLLVLLSYLFEKDF